MSDGHARRDRFDAHWIVGSHAVSPCQFNRNFLSHCCIIFDDRRDTGSSVWNRAYLQPKPNSLVPELKG